MKRIIDQPNSSLQEGIVYATSEPAVSDWDQVASNAIRLAYTRLPHTLCPKDIRVLTVTGRTESLFPEHAIVEISG